MTDTQTTDNPNESKASGSVIAYTFVVLALIIAILLGAMHYPEYVERQSHTSLHGTMKTLYMMAQVYQSQNGVSPFYGAKSFAEVLGRTDMLRPHLLELKCDIETGKQLLHGAKGKPFDFYELIVVTRSYGQFALYSDGSFVPYDPNKPRISDKIHIHIIENTHHDNGYNPVSISEEQSRQ